MKRLIPLLLIATTFGFSLKAQRPEVYTPTGKKINIQWQTLNGLFDSLGVEDPELYFAKGGQVIFKKFTNKPVAVIFDEKPNLAKIPLMVGEYTKKYSEYLLSYSYYHALTEEIKEGKLTPARIADTFGKPDVVNPSEDGDTLKIFKRFNLCIYSNGTPTKANVLNYSAIEKHSLMIGNYEVTGEDYTIGFNISLHNVAYKKIKYAYITVTAFNDVDDVVGKKTVTAVGPIERGNPGSYEFEDIIYSRVASRLKINSIKLQYMDGTQKLIPQAAINSITYRDWEEIGQRTE